MNEEYYLSSRFYRKKTVKEVSKKIELLGVSSNLKTYRFLNIQLFGSVLFFIIGFFFFRFGFLIGPLFCFLYYYGIQYFLLDRRIKIRQKAMEEEAIQFFEILTLSLETGRNLQEAILVTIDSMDGILVNEFREVLKEVQFGKSMTEALRDMAEAIPSDTITNIIVTFTDANIYGSSIIDSLYTQLDYLREKRKAMVKAEISKVPIKISIISVFFFIPLLLLIILGPVLLSYLS